MPTPTKPAEILQMEKKSHRTQRELTQRKQAESELLTGRKLRESEEVKENKTAHKEFLRVEKLLQSIKKADDLYGATINRYCILLAECNEFQEKRELFYKQLNDMEEHEEEIIEAEGIGAYYKMQNSMQKNIIALDRQVQTKRKMLFDLEKENIMTIASSLRSIPKKTEKKKNPLMEALSG